MKTETPNADPHPPTPADTRQVNIFLTNRFVPLPDIAPGERLLARDAGVEGFFHVVARCAKRRGGARVRGRARAAACATPPTRAVRATAPHPCSYGYMERPVQDAAFAASVVDHVLGRLAARVAAAAAADEALRAGLGLPNAFAKMWLAEQAAAGLPGAAGTAAAPLGGGGLAPLDEAASLPGSTRQTAGDEAGGAPLARSPREDAAAATRALVLRAAGDDAARGPLPDRYATVAAAVAECRVLAHAIAQQSVVYIIGAGRPVVGTGGGILGALRRAAVSIPFVALVRCFQEDAAVAFGVPRDQALEVALPYEV